MATYIWVNIGSDDGLLPDGTKPLPEPVLNNQQTNLWHSPYGGSTGNAQDVLH